MTKEELAKEHEDHVFRMEPWKEITHGQSFLQGFIAAESEILELREKLECAVEALDFTLHAAEYLYQSNKELPKGLGAMFYHTLTYEGDLELIQKTKKAREALSRIRGGK